MRRGSESYRVSIAALEQRMQRRLRVASIGSFFHIGGDENRLLSYLAARNRKRFDHLVISGSKASPEMEALWGPVWHRYLALDVETVDLGMPYAFRHNDSRSTAGRELDKVKNFAQFVYRTARVLRKRKIDIVEGRCDTGTVVATLAGRLAGVRAVISTNYFANMSHRARSPAWSLYRGIYPLVDALICDSVACLDEMRHWMVLPPPGYCIPNGIEPPRAERSSEELAAELGIPPQARIVAQISRIKPYKGQHLLLEAASMVLAQEPNAFFLLSGYPNDQAGLDYRDRLKQMVAAQGIGDRVRIVSYPGSVGDLWSLVDVHAHPTLLDSSPIALLEGMSLGKPAVTTRIGGIHELVVDGETGIVLPPGNASALATAILRLLQNPDEAARLGQNAKRRYEAGYTPQIMASRTEDLFEKVYAAPRIRRGSP
jgi:glycosyltransferase involved in cell wall biosynthesis